MRKSEGHKKVVSKSFISLKRLLWAQNGTLKYCDITLWNRTTPSHSLCTLQG
jgi:hypothetical protein